MQKDPELIARAREALKQAHAPYSKYLVGAAIRCEDGTIFTGCNVENASYGLTMCAERSAVFTAVGAGHRGDYVRVAIAAESESGATPFPCGACLQVLAEWGRDLQILIVDQDRVREGTLFQFLPRRFALLGGGGIPAPNGEGRETL